MKSSDRTATVLKNTFNKMAANVLAEVATSDATPTVFVTSASAGHGKTMVAALLAYHCALISEKRVLLIDANMDSPQLATLFGTASTGLVESLLGDLANDLAQPTRLANLQILAAGQSPDSTVLYMQHRVEQLLQRLKAHYDLIVIDAGSADGSAGNSLARCADGVIAVIDATATRKADMDTIHLQLNVEREKVLGAILNRYQQYTPEFLARLL